jgi:modulator of FtsH protease
VTAYDAADRGGFGTTAAAAAATLTGLLFIAVSINLRQILDNAALPGRAAQTLIFFALPMITALLLVVPAQSSPALGWELIATGVVIGAVALIIDHQAGGSEYEPGWSRPVTRVIPMTAGSVCIIVAGAGVAAQAGGGLYWLVPATIIAIIAGLVNTWVLLVEIMR